MKKLDLTAIAAGQTVDIYDGDQSLAESFATAGVEQVVVFTRGDREQDSGTVITRPYKTSLEASDCAADVCVLNDSAIKVLLVMYPSAPRHVLVRLTFHRSWFLGLPGLLRRMLVGLVKMKGVVSIRDANGRCTRWLVVQQTGRASNKIPVLPKKVGIPSLLDWLHKENIEYVVLRFYECLPELYRKGGDLDLLMSNEDKQKVLRFLEEKSHLLSSKTSDINLGLHTVEGDPGPGNIPYYPPPLARQILKNSTSGPAGSRIPASKDAFLSFIYHALYHGKKGYASGIPSVIGKTDEHPENDYAGVIRRMAKELGVEISITMEDLDEYIAGEGWRPKLDTLAKIGETNAWVRDRFFSDGGSTSAGLAVFILREWMVEQGLVDKVLHHMEMGGFSIVRTKILTGDLKQQATDNLRGGTWGADLDGNQSGWGPAMVIVAIDRKCAGLPPAYASGFEHFRIRTLKDSLRNIFDVKGTSSMHSTDNTRESWEYIDICFPDELDAIHAEIDALTRPKGFARWGYLFSFPYLKHSMRYSFREWLICRFLQ